MSENALILMNLEQLPSTQIGTDQDFAAIAKSSNFLPRLQLYTKGKAVNRKLVGPGNYGVPLSEDEVTDLGDEIDILPLARRPKAIDMSDIENIISVYDVNDPEFQRISKTAEQKDSHCMFGPSFLVYERSTGQFLEFFCGTKSMRTEAKKVFPYLPLTPAMIEANPDLMGQKPHGPIPVTLKSKLVERGTYSWHVPVAMKCSTPFTKLPSAEMIYKEIEKFLAVKKEGAEVVLEADNRKERVR